MQTAARQRAAAESARQTREHQALVAARDKRARERAAEQAYTALLVKFTGAVSDAGFPGARSVPVRRTKKPLFGPQVTNVELVVVPRAAFMWYRVGDGLGGPTYSYAQSLFVGSQIRPTLASAWGDREPMPHALYEGARASTEEVFGLRGIFVNHREHDQTPERLPELLQQALAAWAVRHFPQLQL